MGIVAVPIQLPPLPLLGHKAILVSLIKLGEVEIM